MPDEFNFSFSIKKCNQNGLSLYHNLVPIGLSSGKQEYIGTIKYHIVLIHFYLGRVPSAGSLLPPPVTL